MTKPTHALKILLVLDLGLLEIQFDGFDAKQNKRSNCARQVEGQRSGGECKLCIDMPSLSICLGRAASVFDVFFQSQ